MSKTVSKTDLIKKIAAKTGESQAKVGDFLNSFIHIIQDEVANDHEVPLIGFGTFYRTRREATTGRNPRTGQPIEIKATNQPKFRAGKKFKDAVN